MAFGFKNFLHRLLQDVHTSHYFNEIALVGAAANGKSGKGILAIVKQLEAK